LIKGKRRHEKAEMEKSHAKRRVVTNGDERKEEKREYMKEKEKEEKGEGE
jgi:hypothetical protein